MFCRNCGKEIKDDSKFCRYCGISIENIETTEEPEQHYDYFYEEPEPVKKAIRFPIWAVVICISVFVIISVSMFFVFSNITNRKAVNSQLEEDLIFSATEVLINGATTETTDELITAATTEITSKEETTEIISEEPNNANAKDLDLNIQQVDNQNFPDVVIYASANDKNNQTVKQLNKDNFMLFETDKNGQKVYISIDDLYQVSSKDTLNISLVLDKSGSMEEYTNTYSDTKMSQAQESANNFLKQVRFDKGYKVSITCFDDFVYLMHDFSGNLTSLSNTINQITIGDMTALYDAIYSSILNTYPQSGAKCVIAFTDGLENASSYSFDDVVNLSKRTGIPVYIIGIGQECDSDSLLDLAESCSGKYFSVDLNNLSDLLEQIYLDIYNNQEELYVVKYTSPIRENISSERQIIFTAKGSQGYNGKAEKIYIPTPTLNSDFGNYKSDEYILDNSDKELINAGNLENLSLAQLRIARNEIFARHGRLFTDSMLNKWFYSKKWYLNINEKYYPKDFDKIVPYPLNKTELANIDTIKNYENNILSSDKIYPNSDTVMLTEYDLYISKNNLKTALSQIKANNNKTDILLENIKMVENAINREDINY